VAQGWKLVRKDCCIRIELDAYSHVDVALYAIPDDQFSALMEKALASKASGMAFDELADQTYHDLEADTIMLACRSGGWMASDPRAIDDWFRVACETHGEMLRRVCRYVKAWRDFVWPTGTKLNSITLMKCVVDAFDSLGGRFEATRDDAALLAIASKLEGYFADESGVANPVLAKLLNDDWTVEQRREYVAAAKALFKALTGALQSTTDRSVSLELFIQTLGERIPDNPDLIAVETSERLIHTYERTKVVAPNVIRSHSG
jgi:hypothetical protein